MNKRRTIKVSFIILVLMVIAFIPVIGIPLVLFIIFMYLMKNYLNVFRGYRDVKEEWRLIMKENEDMK